jgi:hypothetical protein
MNRWQEFTDEELRALAAGIEDLVAKFPKPVATALFREISDELARRGGAPLWREPRGGPSQ